MRITSLICSLFICCTTVGAQIKTYQLSLKDSSIAEVYLAEHNRIRIEGAKSTDKIEFKEADVLRDSFNIFRVIPLGLGRKTLIIYRNNREIFRKDFETKQLSRPKSRLGAIKDSSASINQIISFPRLLALFENCNYKDEHGWVTRFSLSVLKRNDLVYQESIDGDRLSKEGIEMIRQLRAGDRILIEDIVAVGTFCPTVLDPIVVKIR